MQKHNKRPHIILAEKAAPMPFKTPQGGGAGAALPERDRQKHGAALKAQLSTLQLAAMHAAQAQQQLHLQSGIGLQIEFSGFPDVALAFESLSNEKQKIELLSIRHVGKTTHANVFVPDGKLDHFEKILNKYLNEYKDINGNGRDHKALVNTIAAIGIATLNALWTDDIAQLPADKNQPFWWEVWLPVRNDRAAVLADFRKLIECVGCKVGARQANFPERTVVWMYGSQAQLQQSVSALNCVAELRRAKETAEFFDGLSPPEQVDWVNDALRRLQVNKRSDAPRICLLDSGVNRGHPLLVRCIGSEDLYTVNPAFGKDDRANHGTGLAGVALYGDLTEVLSSNTPIVVDHRLESVKVITGSGGNEGDEHSHAALFGDAVSQPEISAPDAPRVFSSAITASDYRDLGQPSSWSAMVDRLAADVDGEGIFPRLFIQAGGNIVDGNAWKQYPSSLTTNLIHDPGQAWNAITVGAYTEKIDTGENDQAAIAGYGELSPFTTTSAAWESAWPLKPDVVMEGGNVSLASDGFPAGGEASLSLLTTNNAPTKRLFTTTNATSAASALCARLAAQIMYAYPKLRPETVRALITHSADWTSAMRNMYPGSNKADRARLIRHCGWGVPDIGRALYSAGNSLTLLVEDTVHPYKKDHGKPTSDRDMNLHSLPWPKEALMELGAEIVQLRITLSYFIEPNPSARGSSSKFHYPSHRLRFEVQRPTETTKDLVARINAAANRAEGENVIDTNDPGWLLGDRQRYRGSLHQDEWTGTAAELANRGFIAVYPAKGWWRSRAALEKYNSPARYSLVISIRTEQNSVDLYTVVEQVIASKVAVQTGIGVYDVPSIFRLPSDEFYAASFS
ncbi:S8 family peptidase [Massilia sp. W12]|uniref:S8 family peptidase n=1 Tax=Massilia sp. W12 TaxID=3126507 RepID=UPI0030CFB918